jgi:hypothetical protein
MKKKMTQEELQRMLDSYNQETGHIKEWMIDRAMNYKMGAKIRGEQLKSEDRSYLYNEEVNKRRNKSISKDRQENPLNQNQKWVESMANRSEDWNDNIRKARQQQVILQCDLDGKVIKEWPSYKVIQDTIGYIRSTVFAAVKGKKKRGNPHEAYGYLWFSKEL